MITKFSMTITEYCRLHFLECTFDGDIEGVLVMEESVGTLIEFCCNNVLSADKGSTTQQQQTLSFQ